MRILTIASLGILLFLSGCSALAYTGGHFITSGDTAYIPYSAQPPNAPKNPEKCYEHKGRAALCIYPYHPARAAFQLNVLVGIVIFPISLALDVALSPLTFLWGVESGAEHWFGEEKRPAKQDEKEKGQKKEKE